VFFPRRRNKIYEINIVFCSDERTNRISNRCVNSRDLSCSYDHAYTIANYPSLRLFFYSLIWKATLLAGYIGLCVFSTQERPPWTGEREFNRLSSHHVVGLDRTPKGEDITYAVLPRTRQEIERHNDNIPHCKCMFKAETGRKESREQQIYQNSIKWYLPLRQAVGRHTAQYHGEILMMHRSMLRYVVRPRRSCDRQ